MNTLIHSLNKWIRTYLKITIIYTLNVFHSWSLKCIQRFVGQVFWVSRLYVFLITKTISFQSRLYWMRVNPGQDDWRSSASGQDMTSHDVHRHPVSWCNQLSFIAIPSLCVEGRSGSSARLHCLWLGFLPLYWTIAVRVNNWNVYWIVCHVVNVRIGRTSSILLISRIVSVIPVKPPCFICSLFNLNIEPIILPSFANT